MKIFNFPVGLYDVLPQIKLKNKSKGVTLFELGIVLLIISISMAGAYIAYDFFIKRVKNTKIMIEMKDYRKSFESFHSVYGGLPGDITSASRRIASTMVDGNGDGKIASESEQNAFWPHMSYSKIISKKYQNVANNVSPKIDVNLPRLQDSDNIAIGVIYNTPSGVRANSYILGGIDGRSVTIPRFSVEDAQVMDQKFDDNNPITGGVMCGMGVQSGTITACNYSNATTQSDSNIFIPFTPQTTDASNSCPAQSVQISQQLVANAPSIAANATVSYNCRDINPSYSGTYSLTCNPVKNSSNTITGYSISTTATTCSLKTCAVPTLASISGAASIQSAPVQSGQYLSYTCNAGLYATKALCSPNLSTDAASFNPAPACTSSPTGISGNIPIYAIDAQTFQDSGRKFNDVGSTVYDIFSGNKIFGLFGSTSTSQNYIAKYNTQNAGVVPSSIYDNGTSVGIGTATPNASAVLDLSSTTKAFLPPRMTTVQMNAILAPTKGMLIFNTTNNGIYQYNGANWESVQSTVQVAGATPVGTVAVWASATPPSGWVLVDGQTVTSSSNYPELCQVLNGGTLCASGVTKTIPDFRGYFLRGLGTNIDGTNSETWAAPGLLGKTNYTTARPTQSSFYTNYSGDHTHPINIEHTGGWGGLVPQGSDRYSNVMYTYPTNPAGNHNHYIDSGGDGETAPKAMRVNYIMKAQSTSLTPQDINNILSQMMSSVATSSANSFAMFDSTGSKFASTNVYQKTVGTNVSVGVGTATPATSAVLELASTTQGFLPPRMTLAQMNAIVTPQTGMIVYTTDNGTLQMWNGVAWAVITSPSTGPTASTVPTGTIVAWGSNAIPNGWLLLNGGTYSAITYPDLANALTCGSSTCTLPDFRGYFLRGQGTNVDGTYSSTLLAKVGFTTARPQSSFVTENGAAHAHDIGNPSALGGPTSSYATFQVTWPGYYATGFTNGWQYASNISGGAHQHVITQGGDAETAPKNIAVNYIIKAKNVAISQSDLTSMMSYIMTTGTTGNPNAITMFDSTGARFQSSGISQVANVLAYNPTGSSNLMSITSTGMLVSPASGIALQIGESGTGIANANTLGASGLTNTLDFYVNGAKKMSLDANGTLTPTTLSPNSLSVGAGGLTTTTLAASGTSTLTGLLQANGGISTAGLTATSLTLTGSGTFSISGLLTASSGVKFVTKILTETSGYLTFDGAKIFTTKDNIECLLSVTIDENARITSATLLSCSKGGVVTDVNAAAITSRGSTSWDSDKTSGSIYFTMPQNVVSGINLDNYTSTVSSVNTTSCPGYVSNPMPLICPPPSCGAGNIGNTIAITCNSPNIFGTFRLRIVFIPYK